MGQQAEVIDDRRPDRLEVLTSVLILNLGTDVRMKGEVRSKIFKVLYKINGILKTFKIIDFLLLTSVRQFVADFSVQ